MPPSLTSRGILIQPSLELSKQKCQLRKSSPAEKLIISHTMGYPDPRAWRNTLLPQNWLDAEQGGDGDVCVPPPALVATGP